MEIHSATKRSCLWEYSMCHREWINYSFLAWLLVCRLHFSTETSQALSVGGLKKCINEEVWNTDHCFWSLNFRRNLKDDEILEWAEFTHLLPNMNLTDRRGKWIWKLDSNGFNTISLYTFLSSNRHTSMAILYKKLWSSPCPKRVKFLIWEISNSCPNTMDRLQIPCPWINLSLGVAFAMPTMKLSNMSSSIVPHLERFGTEFFTAFNWTVACPNDTQSWLHLLICWTPFKANKEHMWLYLCRFVEDMRWEEWKNLPG